jgi:hypothetical protein
LERDELKNNKYEKEGKKEQGGRKKVQVSKERIKKAGKDRRGKCVERHN